MLSTVQLAEKRSESQSGTEKATNTSKNDALGFAAMDTNSSKMEPITHVLS
jgi:hypothetical protein